MIAGTLASCQQAAWVAPVNIGVQLQFEDSAFDVEGISVILSDAAGIVDYTATTNASGIAEFCVPAGQYTATAVYKLKKITTEGERLTYVLNSSIAVKPGRSEPIKADLLKVVSQQVIIKELYNGGCLSADGLGAYQNDQYFTIYNNSAETADISDLVFGIGAPYLSYSNNLYYGEDGVLIYEKEDWMPAGGALWWFMEEQVTLAPYTSLTVAVASATDHTSVNPNSVDLSKEEYYWMCPVGLGQMYDRARKYAVSENIPQSHYLTGKAFAMTPTGWPLSTESPTFFTGKMPREQALALCSDTPALDQTLGAGAMFSCVKFPKACVYDAVEVWTKGNEETSHVRFSADINSNYVLLTPKLGYSVYRNVDKEATEELPENAGKLVYGYTGGTDDVEGTTDPSGIDAEASIANGAHIIYSDTNNSFVDFHQRKVISLKK